MKEKGREEERREDGWIYEIVTGCVAVYNNLFVFIYSLWGRERPSHHVERERDSE